MTRFIFNLNDRTVIKLKYLCKLYGMNSELMLESLINKQYEIVTGEG